MYSQASQIISTELPCIRLISKEQLEKICYCCLKGSSFFPTASFKIRQPNFNRNLEVTSYSKASSALN